ncbi:MAG: TIGR03790 family protein [Akkermansiaceae bacterium]|nr:TIGR03790 family protein [Akkermansiaceae bacterium]
MRRTLLALIGWCCATASALATLKPAEVAVVYNSALPESAQLARLYCELRKVPEANLIGLKLPVAADISRSEFDTTIRKPLRDEFQERGYWELGLDANRMMLPVKNKIRVILLMRGVPLRIKPEPKPADFKADPKDPLSPRDEAAVDSELSLLGVEGLPVKGVLENKFYQSESPLNECKLPFVMLVARIDAASAKTCERMMRDTVETETAGLWGMAYVDLANKGDQGEGYKMGDDWLEAVIAANLKAGIPTVVDRFSDTLPKNYPMGDASLYYGWYDWHVSGPLLNPAFKFRKGAVAMHLHSFSAQQLRDVTKNWCAPLLEKGAAVTVGNVYEPYLHLTHNLGILHQRLLSGMTWVEAAWAAMPVASWQGVVLGDPLYRPFARLNGSGPRLKENSSFMALRMAALKWGDDPAEYRKQLLAASERMKSGTLAEALGLWLVSRGKSAEATVFFNAAKEHYPTPSDKIRQDFNLIAIQRAAPGGKAQAINALRAARSRCGKAPEAVALAAWLDILDPPPPPAANPKNSKKPAATGKKK